MLSRVFRGAGRDHIALVRLDVQAVAVFLQVAVALHYTAVTAQSEVRSVMRLQEVLVVFFAHAWNVTIQAFRGIAAWIPCLPLEVRIYIFQ